MVCLLAIVFVCRFLDWNGYSQLGGVANACQAPDAFHKTIWEAVIGNSVEKGRPFKNKLAGGWMNHLSIKLTPKASSLKSENIFSIERKALFYFQWRNALQVWYNWCHCNIYANFFSRSKSLACIFLSQIYFYLVWQKNWCKLNCD